MPNKNLITQTESSDVSLTFIGIAMSLASLLTVLANIVVVVTYFKCKKLQIAANYFIVSLAVADIVIGAIPVNFYTAYMLEGKWPFDGATCTLWLCVDHWSITASTLTLMGIAFDRYFAICHPIKHRVLHTKRNVKIVIAVIWIVAFFVWVPAIIAYPYIVENNTVPSDQCYIQFVFESPFVTLVTVVCSYYFPLFVIVTLYALICYRLMKVAERKTEQQKNNVTIEVNSSFLEANIAIISTAVNGSFTSIDEKPSNISRYLDNGNHPPSNNRVRDLQKNPPGEDTSSATKKRGRSHKRSVKLLLFVSLAFAITWMPYFVTTTVITITGLKIPERLWRFCYICGWLNSLLNPLCYASGNRNFKDGFKHFFCGGSRNYNTRP